MATTVTIDQTASTLPQKKGDPPNLGTVKSGRALAFDGVVDYLDIGDTTFIDFSAQSTTAEKAWTVAAWINYDAVGTTRQNIIGGNNNTASGTIAISTDETLYIYDHGAGIGRNGDTTLVASKWYRAVWVFDGSDTVTFYLDGASDGTAAIGAGSDNYDLRFQYIGIWDSSARIFGGSMSDLQIWQGAWTATDVTNDYRHPEMLAHTFSGTSLTESNLKAWYPMTEGNPESPQTTIFDGSPKVLSAELLTNEDFTAWTGTPTTDTPNNWTVEITETAAIYVTQSGSACRLVSTSGDFQAIKQTVMTAGKVYKWSINITDVTAGTLRIQDTDDTTTFILSGTSTLGVHTGYHTAIGTNFRICRGSGVTDITFTDVSVKEVQRGNHAASVFYGDELISDAKNRTGFASHDWTHYQSASGNINVSGSKLFITCNSSAGAGDNQGAQLGIALVDDEDTNSIVAGKTYRIQADLDFTTIADSDLVVKFALGNTSEVITASDGSPSGGTIDATEQTYYADITTADATGNLRINCTAATNDSGSDNIFSVDNISVKEVGLSTTGHVEGQETIFQPAFVGQNRMIAFDGVDDKVDLGSAKPNDGTGDISISAWINPNSFGGGDSSRIYDNGNLVFHIQATESTLGVSRDASTWLYAADDSISLNTWIHVLVTSSSDGASTNFYVNGSLSGTANQDATTPVAKSTNTFIGNRNDGARAFDGIITELSVWTSILSLSQIQELYNDGVALDLTSNTLTGSPTLIGYWRNNELHTDGKWKDLTESDGSGDNGTLTGGSTVIFPEGTTSDRDINGFFLTHPNKNWLNSYHQALTGGNDDGGYIDIPYSDVFDINTGDFTIECWVKNTFTNIGSSFNVAVSCGDGLDATGFLIATGGNSIIFYVNTIAIDNNTHNDVGKWYHVVGLRTAGACRIYINGVYKEEVTGGAEANTITDTTGFSIGTDAGHTQRQYNDAVDDVRFYNRALTDGGVSVGAVAGGEIAKNYRHGTAKHKPLGS